MLWPTQIHPSLRRKPEGFFAFQVLENNQRICHPERAQRVEGSSSFAPQYSQITGKILRLRASRSAQDDIRFCDSSVYRIWALDSHCQLSIHLHPIPNKQPVPGHSGEGPSYLVGSSAVKVIRPASQQAQILPPWAFTMLSAMDRPRPKLPSRLRAASRR